MNAFPNAAQSDQSDFRIALDLARLLEGYEQGKLKVDAGQYQLVVGKLESALDRLHSPEMLDALLNLSPAASEIYENMHYQFAGLCRAPIDSATSAELAARDVLAHAKANTGTTK